MSTVTLQLPDDLERELQSRAKAQGRDVASVALDILQSKLIEPKPNVDPNDVPYDEWSREFMAWVKSRPRIDVEVDDSRETIYEGR